MCFKNQSRPRQIREQSRISTFYIFSLKMKLQKQPFQYLGNFVALNK